jgi:hypothetical protein
MADTPSNAERSEKSMPSINHWTVRDFKQNVTRKELVDILLFHDNIIRAGRILYAKTKHLGAGVYQLWYEEPATSEKGPKQP